MFSDNDICLFCKLNPAFKINSSLQIIVLQVRVAEKGVTPPVTASDLIVQVTQMGCFRY